MGALHRAFELPGNTLKIVCECGNRECVERIDISTDDYEEVRCNSIDFIVVPDHDERDVEEVVRNEAGYQVVRKTAPKGRAVARENDPRRGMHPDPNRFSL